MRYKFHCLANQADELTEHNGRLIDSAGHLFELKAGPPTQRLGGDVPERFT